MTNSSPNLLNGNSDKTRKQRFLLVISIAISGLVLTNCPLVAQATNPKSPGAWGAQVLVPGNFSGPVALDGDLFAVKYAATGPLARGSRLVRVDARTGDVLATSTILPGISTPVLVDGSLWTSGVTFVSKNDEHEGPPVLERVNPLTLHVESTKLLHGATSTVSLVGEGNKLFELSSTQSSCSLQRIDPQDGSPINAFRIRLPSGQCAGAVIDEEGQFLYVQIHTGSVIGDDSLLKIDASSASIVGQVTIPDYAQEVSIAANDTGVWVAGGMPGVNGNLFYLSASPLKLLAGSRPVDQYPSNLHIKFDLPLFSQFPSVTIADGVVWVASDGTLACLHSASGLPIDTAMTNRSPIITSSFEVVGGFTWANADYSSPGPGIGLARIHPPAACFSQ